MLNKYNITILNCKKEFEFKKNITLDDMNMYLDIEDSENILSYELREFLKEKLYQLYNSIVDAIENGDNDVYFTEIVNEDD